MSSNVIVEVNRLAYLISSLAEDLFYQGKMDFYEVVSVDAIKSSLQWFISENLVRVQKVDGLAAWSNRRQRLIQVPASKTSDLEELTAQIGRYRKRIALEPRSISRL